MRRAAPLLAAAAAAAGIAPGAHAGLSAFFGAASYRPGDTARLHVEGGGAETLQLLACGPGGGPLALAPMDDPRRVHGAAVAVRIWSWPSGLYFARLEGAGGTAYAPFVLRPSTLGAHRVAVVLQTYTWQAYNDFGGGSWYFGGGPTVSLARPYLDRGVPPHFRGYDLGFLRWLARTQRQVDVLSDEDLERLQSAARLAQLYDLVVFPGHEEYVTQHVYDLVTGHRDAGGNLMFLSADNFFYRVLRSGGTITRSGRWRDLGRPEAAGIQVLAQIPDDFGPGESAQMTYYERGAARVFAAGVMNFGASADWPVVSTLMANLWQRLGRP